VVPLVLQKMNYWCQQTGHKFRFNHISDSAAFSQMRTDGSYDVRDFEAHAFKLLEKRTELYPELPHLQFVRMNPAPKGAGSVPGRSRMVISKLQKHEIIVSCSCVRTVEMFERIEQKREKGNGYDAVLPFTPQRSRYIHILDSMSYPMWFYDMGLQPFGDYDPEQAQSVFLDLNV